MSKKIIIVIEDDKDILEIIHLILHKEYDLHLFTAPPEDFVDIVASKNPALIIFDWLIPNVVVEDFIEPIRKNSPSTKILITSAHNNLEKVFTDKDVDGLLPKPFGVKVLKATIKKVIRDKKSIPTSSKV